MKLLLVRFSSLGDVVLATAAATALKAGLPGVKICFLTKAAYAPLLKGHPDLDEVWGMDTRGEHAGAGGGLSMARRVREASFDGVLDLHGNPRARWISGASGTQVSRVKNHALKRRLRVWARWLKLSSPPDVVERGRLAASRLAGIELPKSEPRLSVGPDAAAWAVEFLLSQGVKADERLLAVSVGAAHATKRWPEEHFAASLGALARPGRRFLFVGDARDAESAARIVAAAGKSGEGALIAAGKTDFPRLAALLHRSEALLTNDSGPMHVAAALGIPLVALFGPTVREFGFFPRGPRSRAVEAALTCRPCSVHGTDTCPLGHHDCMRKLAPADVARDLEEAIQG